MKLKSFNLYRVGDKYYMMNLGTNCPTEFIVTSIKGYYIRVLHLSSNRERFQHKNISPYGGSVVRVPL